MDIDEKSNIKNSLRKGVGIMNTKKIISILLTGTVAMSLLAGCGSDTENNQGSTKQTAQNDTEISKKTLDDTSEMAASDNTEVPTSESGNTLVVYYSATGNTEAVANTIAGLTNADILKLEPVQPYSDADLDWTDEDSRVSREHENEEERIVELTAETVDDWQSYENIYIGYPLWWGIAAWPVEGFVKANDFTGKTVIPFATSSSSGIGESGELLAEMAGTGDWQDGKRFSSGVSEEDVKAWVEELRLSQ